MPEAADPDGRDTRRRAPANGQGPRSRKGVQTRARLLDAARAVFERDGFLSARISDIAATAGLAQGSFYHYFESKEQIFREVAKAQEERLAAPAGDLADETVEAGIRRYLERYRDAAALMGVIEQVSRYDDEVNAARLATQRHFAKSAERALRERQLAGEADARLDARLAADALGAMMNRFAELWLVQGYRDYDFEQAVEQLTLLCANALGVADEAPATRPRATAAARAGGSRTRR